MDPIPLRINWSYRSITVTCPRRVRIFSTTRMPSLHSKDYRTFKLRLIGATGLTGKFSVGVGSRCVWLIWLAVV